MESPVSHHFGRCPQFTVVRVEDDRVMSIEVVDNPHFHAHGPGQVPAFVHGLGADVILAGGMGPRAVSLFHSYGIDVATGAGGRVDDALRAYLEGTLSGIVPCAHDHPDGCGSGPHHHH